MRPNFSVFFNYQTYVQANNKTTINQCFSVSAPNNSFDEDRSNNQLCSVLITSTIQAQLKEDFSIFPNPANTQLQVQSTQLAQLHSLYLFDAQGKSIPVNWTKTATGAQIETSSIRNGFYFLKIQSLKGVITKSIVIQH